MKKQIHRKSLHVRDNLTSIIIPCWNQLDYTKLCLESVFKYSGSGYELILINNGSADGTAAYCAEIRKTAPVSVTVITNQENRGFPAAINQGLQVAKGDYLLLLNNDAVVTEGWLDRLIAISKNKLDDGQPVGLAGPMSNYVTPPQVVQSVPYQTIDAVHDFAQKWKEDHLGKWISTNKVSGFCLLMTREVYQTVGGFDEDFGLGFFDDDDFSLRVRKAGFGIAIAQDVYIHHFGNRTMIGNGIDAEALLNTNQARFITKWGNEAPRIVREKSQNQENKHVIVDAVIFHCEYEMLEFRLKLLYPHVDKFIIVEADKTFSGLDKPFYYEQNKERFAWAEDKIIYFTLHCDTSRLNLTSRPTEYQPTHDCWQIEYAQRNAIVTACNGLADNTLLMMGDVDEIPSLDAITWAKQNIGQLPAVCQQHFFYYDLRYLREEPYLSTIFSTLGAARGRGAQDLRNHRNVLTRLANAGWHLSYFCDADAIINKIESFSHQELNTPEFKDKEYINNCRSSGADLFKRGTKVIKVSQESFPPYFRNATPAHWWGSNERTSKRATSTGRTRKTNKRAKVSLTMIVRDEEKNLPVCLESVSGVFDEIIVIDTGSADRTKEIAAQFGAKVFDSAWIDDFSAARNVALDHATGDYAFWLDADDIIDPPHKKMLKDLLKQLHPDSHEAFVLRCVCNTESNSQIVVDHPRLFPLLEGIRWERRIHEVINLALDRAGIPMVWTDIVIRHTGYADAAMHERKRQRNLLLLQKELAERPDDPFIYYYLGTLAFERSKWQEALGYFILSLAKWGTTQSIACKLFAMIAWTNQILQRYEESLRVANEGVSYFPNDGELWFRKAIALRYLHRPTEAETCFTRILSLGRPKTLYNVEPGIYGYMTRGNLAIIAEERGDYNLARTHWQAVLEESPGYPEALRRLAKMAA